VITPLALVAFPVSLAEGGVIGFLLVVVGSFVAAILTGRLEPKATAKRVEEIQQDRIETLKAVLSISEEARKESLEVSRESLQTSKASLALLQDIRREAALTRGEDPRA